MHTDGRALHLPSWLALVAALAALGALVLRPWQGEAPADAATGAAKAAGEAGAARDDSSARPEPAHDAERAKLAELHAMSETFRNTTFLIAIRDAGYTCGELADVYGGFNNSHTWTVTCSDMLSYTVSVTPAGALGIAPMPQFLDGLAPRPIERQPPTVVPLEPR